MHDISSDAGRNAHGIKRGSAAWRLTSDCAEVAIAGTVPAEAIIGMIDTTMLGVAHRSTVKQTIAEFKDTVPSDARWRLR